MGSEVYLKPSSILRVLRVESDDCSLWFLLPSRPLCFHKGSKYDLETTSLNDFVATCFVFLNS